MAKKMDEKRIGQELLEMLSGTFEGITVEISHSSRWDRMCATFVWDGFSDLLPEERFYRLSRVIPEEFREKHMKGFVWLELAPKEPLESFLKLPRSEDIAPKEANVYRSLAKSGFFDALAKAMGPSPDSSCDGTFAHTLQTLKESGNTPVGDAKLVFIRHRSYCDCQVLMTALPALTQAYEKVAG